MSTINKEQEKIFNRLMDSYDPPYWEFNGLYYHMMNNLSPELFSIWEQWHGEIQYELELDQTVTIRDSLPKIEFDKAEHIYDDDYFENERQERYEKYLRETEAVDARWDEVYNFFSPPPVPEPPWGEEKYRMPNQQFYEMTYLLEGEELDEWLQQYHEESVIADRAEANARLDKNVELAYDIIPRLAGRYMKFHMLTAPGLSTFTTYAQAKTFEEKNLGVIDWEYTGAFAKAAMSTIMAGLTPYYDPSNLYFTANDLLAEKLSRLENDYDYDIIDFFQNESLDMDDAKTLLRSVYTGIPLGGELLASLFVDKDLNWKSLIGLGEDSIEAYDEYLGKKFGLTNQLPYLSAIKNLAHFYQDYGSDPNRGFFLRQKAVNEESLPNVNDNPLTGGPSEAELIALWEQDNEARLERHQALIEQLIETAQLAADAGFQAIEQIDFPEDNTTVEMDTEINTENTANITLNVENINEASDIDDLMAAVTNQLAEITLSVLNVGA